MSFEEALVHKFNELKQEVNTWICPVFSGETPIAYLEPIRFGYKEKYPYLPELLGRWRKENPTLSNSQFEITKENTTNWLDNLVLKRKDRILFMIFDWETKKPLGHIGFSSVNFEEHSAEIDCVLRGEITPPGTKLMPHTLIIMLRLGYTWFDLDAIYLSVSKINTPAIKLYLEAGFIPLYDIPLFSHVLPSGELRWDYDATKDPVLAEKTDIYMRHSKELI
jgi:RimJ/RimL family protein N-acetyltransferase